MVSSRGAALNLENGLPLLLDGASACSFLLALNNWVRDAVARAPRLSINDRARCFFWLPRRVEICAPALWCGLVYDRVQASVGALGMLVFVWSASPALAS